MIYVQDLEDQCSRIEIMLGTIALRKAMWVDDLYIDMSFMLSVVIVIFLLSIFMEARAYVPASQCLIIA